MDTIFTQSNVVEGLKSDDSRALNFLFAEFYKPLQYFAERLISDREEAKDIVITAFRKFWDIRHNFESFPNIRAFFYIVVRNECLDYLKYKKRNREVRKDFEYIHSTEALKSADRAVIESDLMYQIYLEVQNLPDRCREIFLLTYFNGMKANEIADKLGISVSTVTSQRAIAIRYLKEVLSNDKFCILIVFLASLSSEHSSLSKIN